MKPDIKQIKGIENYKKYKLKSDFTTNGTKFLFKKDSIVYAKPSYNKDFLDVVNAKENLILIPVNILEIVPNETKITDLSYQLGIPTSETIRTMPPANSKTAIETAVETEQPTTTTTTTSNQVVNDVTKGYTTFAKSIQMGGLIGTLSGLGIAYFRKSSIGGYIGWSVLLGIGGAVIGGMIGGKKALATQSGSKSGSASGASDKVTDDKLIDAMINSMRQMVVSLAVTFGQDKAKAEADFNTDFEKQKPQVIAKGKEVLATMKDNEKQAVYEMILFETDLYSKAKTQEDAEKIEPQLNSKIQELSTKYSVDLKAAIDKLKGQKF